MSGRKKGRTPVNYIVVLNSI